MTLLAAYSFDEASGDLLDYSGNNRHIPLASPASRVAGKDGTGLSQSVTGIFNGPAGLVSAFQTPNRTIVMDVKELVAVTGWLFEFYVSSIDSGAWGILFLNGNWQVQARNSGGFVRAAVARPTDNQFHQAACTYDGTNVRFYLNGSLAATQALTAPLRTDATAIRVQDQSTSSVVMDNVRIYDEALSQSAIQALLNVPVVAGRTGKPKVWNGTGWNSHLAKVWNGTSWVPHKMAGYNGTDWVYSK